MHFYRKHHQASKVRDQNKRMNFPSLIARDFQNKQQKSRTTKKKQNKQKAEQTTKQKTEQAKNKNKTHFHLEINESLSS